MTAGIANCCCALALERSSRSVPKREETKVDLAFCALSMVGLMRTNMDQHRPIWRTKYGTGMALYLWGCSPKKRAFGSLFNVLELSLSPAFITFRKILTWPQWYHVLKGKIELYFLANSLRVVSNFGARKEQSKYTHTHETSLALEVEFRECARVLHALLCCVEIIDY